MDASCIRINIVSFTDVRVPLSAPAGKRHRGFDLAPAGVSTEHIYTVGRSRVVS